jgi:hypothetical protein
MDEENKSQLKDYYKSYQQSEYSRNYYKMYKDRFKKYYETYKKNKLNTENGNIRKPNKIKKTRRELDVIKWNRRLANNERKKLEFIKQLQQEGILTDEKNL